MVRRTPAQIAAYEKAQAELPSRYVQSKRDRDPEHWGPTNRKAELKYDEFRDSTAIEMLVDHSMLEFRIQETYVLVRGAWSGHSCKRDCSPIVALELFSKTDEWAFLDVHEWLLLAGDQRLTIKSEHRGDVGHGYVLETIVAQLETKQLRQLLNTGEPIKARVGIMTFELNREHLATFLAALETPSTATPADAKPVAVHP